MAAKNWQLALVALVALVAGFVLAGGGLSRVDAQSEGRTAGVICVMGEQLNGSAPLVIVDVPDQSVVIYEYDYRNDRIELTAARTYQYDKLLPNFNTEGPTVEEVRAWAMQR